MGKIEMKHKIVLGGIFLSLLLFVGVADAAGGRTIGSVAATITESFRSLAKLITAASYIAGLAFSIGAIMKFKQHKDNPTQTPIGAPIGLLVVAAALLFMPSVMGMAGATMFAGGSTAGPSGTIFTGS